MGAHSDDQHADDRRAVDRRAVDRRAEDRRDDDRRADVWDPDMPISDEAEAPDILAAETVFAGKVWNIRRETFRYNGDEIVREFVDHTGAVAVLALDDDDRALLIRQYRHPVRNRDWEIPAGLLDLHGEPPLEAAKRELAEEADLEADDWSVLAEFYTSPGGSDEAIRIYLARTVRETAEVFDRTEEEADIEKRWVHLDEVVDGVLARRIQNPSLIIAALAARTARETGWSQLGAADSPWPRHPKLGDSGAHDAGRHESDGAAQS